MSAAERAEETIADRLSDAGYIQYAEDEDGGVPWIIAPLDEVLRIVTAAQAATDTPSMFDDDREDGDQ